MAFKEEMNMLSNKTWNALCKAGKEDYEPMLGKTYRDTTTGYVGKARYYTLCGQINLDNGTNEFYMAWAKNLVEVQ